MAQTRESLLRGKDQYSWPPCTNLFKPEALYTETIFFVQNNLSKWGGQLYLALPFIKGSLLKLFSGLYYKNILTIVSDDRKWCLYYKCFMCPSLRLSKFRQLCL